MRARQDWYVRCGNGCAGAVPARPRSVCWACEVVASAEAVATVHTPSEMSELSPRMSNAHGWPRCVEAGWGHKLAGNV